MRHRLSGKKLSRTSQQRQALFKSLLQALILKEKIITTEAKAKVLKRLMDKLMTVGKKGTLAARRQILALLPDKESGHKLFNVLVPRAGTRTSGFTKSVRLGSRKGDNTMAVQVEFVDKAKEAPKK